MINKQALLALVFNFSVLALAPSWAQEVIGSCEKDGYELRLTIIETPVPGNNAAEAFPAAQAATASFQLSSIRPGPMREDDECTRIKWRSQGGCIKANGILSLPRMDNNQVADCSSYNEVMQSIKDMMSKNLRERTTQFRHSLGQCVSAQENGVRIAKAEAAALSGDANKNGSLKQQIESLLNMAATKVDGCVPSVSVKEYGSRAYYQSDDSGKKMCGPEVDPQMIGVRVYAPANPLMNKVNISIIGGDGVLILSQTNVIATVPGTVGSIFGYAMCEPKDAPSYLTSHPFTLIASEPVRWNGTPPQRTHQAHLERKCMNTTC